MSIKPAYLDILPGYVHDVDMRINGDRSFGKVVEKKKRY
jgi:hypothetical protein